MLKYSLVSNDSGSALTLLHDGELYVAQSDTHPNWNTILNKVLAGDESVVGDFDPGTTAARKFERLTERVTLAAGRLYFDGDEITQEGLTKQVLRFLEAGVDDWKPLVNFYEKVMQNPSKHSREQAYHWLEKHNFAISADGDVVGYKSVYSSGDGTYRPSHAGPGTVDGVEFVGDDTFLTQRVGSVVEMPRSAVVHDPTRSCSVGLHVSNYGYAKTFSGDTMLRVAFNPRDIVSVPTEGGAYEKVRVSRYRVLEATPKTDYVYDEDEVFYREDGEVCDECGAFLDLCDCGDYDEEDEYGDPHGEDFGYDVPPVTDYRHNQRDDKGRFTKRA